MDFEGLVDYDRLGVRSGPRYLDPEVDTEIPVPEHSKSLQKRCEQPGTSVGYRRIGNKTLHPVP